MSDNITSYNILSKYYDKIYKYQLGHQNLDKRDKYLKFLLSNISHKHKYLDIGCGTGIYTNIISNKFEECIGIDPCNDMINQTIKKDNIMFKTMYLNKLNETNFDLITSFTQVFSHLTYKMLVEYIQLVSSKLNKNGIFYFDYFNYEYFKINKPKKETRYLDEKCEYIINPELVQKDDITLELNLNNHIKVVDTLYPYNLKLNIIDFNHINKICEDNNLNLISLSNMFDIENNINSNNINKFAKFGAIFKKII